MTFLSDSKEIVLKLTALPKEWEAKAAILEMKAADYSHWKQMEWIGFYFQYLCEKHLAGLVEMPGPKYGNVSFDGLYNRAWDFKAHAMNTSSHQLIVNDCEATNRAVNDYGSVGLILAVGKVEYNDEARTFQNWHEELKGGKSDYERKRIERGAWSRLRKVSFDLQQLSFIEITENTLRDCGSFQADFRNADGSARRSKVMIDLEEINEELKLVVDYKAEKPKLHKPLHY
ncbi:MAG: hypothetical protein WC490_07420 [Candidatus Margulisiibacteriota bacterium]